VVQSRGEGQREGDACGEKKRGKQGGIAMGHGAKEQGHCALDRLVGQIKRVGDGAQILQHAVFENCAPGFGLGQHDAAPDERGDGFFRAGEEADGTSAEDAGEQSPAVAAQPGGTGQAQGKIRRGVREKGA